MFSKLPYQSYLKMKTLNGGGIELRFYRIRFLVVVGVSVSDDGSHFETPSLVLLEFYHILLTETNKW